MKPLALVLMSLLAAGCAVTAERDYEKGESVPVLDGAEYAWFGLHAVDGYQTATRCEQLREVNPLLGPQPTDAQVALFVVGTGMLYHYVRRWIKEEHPESLKTYDRVLIGVKLATVAWNAKQRDKCQ